MNVKLSLFLYAYKLFIPKCLPLDSVRLLLSTMVSNKIYYKCQGYRLKTTMQKTMDSKAKDFSFRSASVER